MAQDNVGDPPAVQVFALGGFRVLVRGHAVEEQAWRRKAARQLFKRLLTRSSRRMTRDEIVELLWPDSNAEAAATNLRSSVHALRRALEPAEPDAIGMVFGDRDSVWLRPDVELWLDADEFERALEHAWRSSDPLSALEQASALYVGHYLPDDLYEDWATERRETLKQQWAELQLRLSRELERRGDADAAVRPLQRLLQVDPCDERAAREAMQLLARHGRRTEALRIYQHLTSALADELGVEPSEETATIQRHIVGGDIAETTLGQTFRCAYPFPTPAQMIDREIEFGILERVLESGRTSGQVALVGAPAGTGKSALVGQLVTRAQLQGIVCLAGGCYEDRGAVPLGPFHDALVDFLLAQPAERLRADFGAIAEDLVQVVPEVRYHLNLSAPASVSFPSGDRMRAFAAIHACLRALAERGPVLICLEDLHAADEATLQLFHFLARQTRRLPLVLVGTYRTDEADPDQPLARTLAAISRERLAHELLLRSLDRKDTGDMVKGLLKGSPSKALADSLYSTTGGNPLFVEQQVMALLETGQLKHSAGIWEGVAELQRMPQIVREVIAQRLRRLPASCREILSMASVLGKSFEHGVLLAAVEAVDESRLLLDLDRALAAHVLQETQSGYSFRHGLLREAVYWDLSAPKRMQLHARAGEVLEQLLGPHATDHAAELAHHFGLAGAGESVRSRALRYSMEAGQRAASLSAYAEALGHFSQACEIIESNPSTMPLEISLDALEGRGRAERELAMWPRAVTTFGRVLELTEDAQRRARVRAVLVSAMLYGDPARALQEVELGLAELKSSANTGPQVALAGLHLQSLKGLVWFLHGRYSDLRALGEQMVQSVADSDQPLGRAWAHSVIGWAHQGQGHIGQGLEHYFRALEAAQAERNKVQEAVVRVNLGQLMYLGGQFGPAHEQLDTAIALYQESAGDLPTLNALFCVALLRLAEGQVERAREQAQTALAMAIQARIRFAADYHDVLGRIQSLRNEWSAAEASFEQSIAIRKEVGYAAGTAGSLLGLGMVHQRRGDLDQARALYQEALAITEAIDPCLEVVAAHRHIASLCLRAGETVDAADHLARATSLILTEGLQDTLEYSCTLLIDSFLQSALDRPAEALELAEQSLAAARTMECAFEARVAIAVLQAAAGQADNAHAHVFEALQMAERLGGPRLRGMAYRAAAHVHATRGNQAEATASLRLALDYFEAARTPHERLMVMNELRDVGSIALHVITARPVRRSRSEYAQ